MAQSRSQQRSSQQSDVPDLFPAIFTSFPGLSFPALKQPPTPNNSAPTNEKETRIQKTQDYLQHQQENVHENMLYITTQKAQKMIAEARAEIESILDNDEGNNLDRMDIDVDSVAEDQNSRKEEEKTQKLLKEEIEQVLSNIRHQAPSEPPSTFYISRETHKETRKHSQPPQNPYQDLNRTPEVIRKDLAWRLRVLIEETVKEVEDYDTISAHTRAEVLHALQNDTTNSFANSAQAQRRNSTAGSPIITPYANIRGFGNPPTSNTNTNTNTNPGYGSTGNFNVRKNSIDTSAQSSPQTASTSVQSPLEQRSEKPERPELTRRRSVKFGEVYYEGKAQEGKKERGGEKAKSILKR